jgi:hypothetical protein
MKELTIKGYAINELSGEAKTKALDYFRDIDVMHDWWEPMMEGFYEKMRTYGLTGELYFSGFYSQGDGACFIADTVDTDLLIRTLFEEGHDIPEDCLLYSKDIHIRIQKSAAAFASRYSHENTIEAYVHNEDYEQISAKECIHLENVITEWIRTECKAIHKSLQNYYEELQSDENVEEMIIENEHLFTLCGEYISLTKYSEQ